MPSTRQREYQTASYCVHSVPAHFCIKTERVNSKIQFNLVGFYKHVFHFIIGKLWGLGKGGEKIVKRHHCPPESPHCSGATGRKMTAKHGRSEQRAGLVE